MHVNLLFVALIFAIGVSSPVLAGGDRCPSKSGVAVQVLGSGGPIADDGRASAGYLVWIDGESRVLIDAGGGTFLRFAEANASFDELEFIGLSHFHADHSADFAALLKSGSFGNKKQRLTVSGPGGSALFPGLNAFLTSLLNPQDGAFAYLSGYLVGGRGLPKLTVLEIDPHNTGPVAVFEDHDGRLQIDALHVPHGIVPALAFRVQTGNHTIVFASDQNGNNPEFIEFARGANVLVMHMPVPEGVSGTGRRLHAPPSVIGTIAQSAAVEMLVISHLMQRSLDNLEHNLATVRANFSGRVDVADDLRCYTLDNQET